MVAVAAQIADDSDHASAGILEILLRREAMGTVNHSVTGSFAVVQDVLPQMLAASEDDVTYDELRRPEDVRAAAGLVGADALYAELAQASQKYTYDEELTNDVKVRLAIVVKALENVSAIFGGLEELCIKEASHGGRRH